MWYLKRFQTNADYQAFKNGDEWTTPNVSAIEENSGVVFEPPSIFPCYLNVGENGEKGIALYNFLVEQYNLNPRYEITTEEIYIEPHKIGGNNYGRGLVTQVHFTLLTNNPPYIWFNVNNSTGERHLYSTGKVASYGSSGGSD
jgi:hypothetical protein